MFKIEEIDNRAPITVKFEIPYFTVSGIQVRYLKIVEKSGYQALPWVRYITQVRRESLLSVFTEQIIDRLFPFSPFFLCLVQNGDDYSLRTNSKKGGAPIAPL
jgi:AP-1 complex subunit mu